MPHASPLLHGPHCPLVLTPPYPPEIVLVAKMDLFIVPARGGRSRLNSEGSALLRQARGGRGAGSGRSAGGGGSATAATAACKAAAPSKPHPLTLSRNCVTCAEPGRAAIVCRGLLLPRLLLSQCLARASLLVAPPRPSLRRVLSESGGQGLIQWCAQGQSDLPPLP